MTAMKCARYRKMPLHRASWISLAAAAALAAARHAHSFHAPSPPAALHRHASAAAGRRGVALGAREGEGGDDLADESGQELARQFYEQVRLRERDDASATRGGPDEGYRESNSSNNGDGRPQGAGETLSESEARYQNRDPFINRREVNAGRDGSSRQTKKFTGRQTGVPSQPSSSAGFFSGQGASVFSVPLDPTTPGQRGAPAATPRDRMMANEIKLVGRFGGETSIFLQAGLALVLLTLYAAVGLSGGITDGSERFGLNPAEFNVIEESMEAVANTLRENAEAGGAVAADAVDVVVKSVDGSVWL